MQAAPDNPPDVWVQLLHHLLRDATCRQALLQRSLAAATAFAELKLAQLAAKLAEELAVTAAASGTKLADTPLDRNVSAMQL